jgi:hypothetical protein
MGEVLYVQATLADAGECPTCGVRFAMPLNMLRTLRETKGTFYCPNGHQQSFAESSTVRLRRELEQTQERLKQAEDLAVRRGRERDQLALTKAQTLGKLKALKQRAANGFCPCCKRSFMQLARHMRTKHPAWVEEQNKHEADGADEAKP